MKGATMLSDKSIEEFQQLYKKHFGKEISKQEAMEQGLKLIQLMKAVLKPSKKRLK
jgi:hypothetical protein